MVRWRTERITLNTKPNLTQSKYDINIKLNLKKIVFLTESKQRN